MKTWHNGAPVDVASFAEVRSWDLPHDFGLQWSEARDIERVVVNWKDAAPDCSDVALEYWKGQWPEKRVPKGLVSGGGFPGWMAEDDWFTGRWQAADVTLGADGKRWEYTFSSLDAVEFPDIAEFPARFRHTLKLRLVSRGKLPTVASLETYTDSTWRERNVLIEWGGTAKKQEQNWDGHFELYNGHVDTVKPFGQRSRVTITGATWKSRVFNNTDGISCALWTAANSDPTTHDGTVVTVRAHAHSFSFAVSDLDEGPLFLKDFGVLVSLPSHGQKLHTAMKSVPSARTYFDRISELPEQTLPRAWADMPAKKSFYTIIGMEGRRQRFGVDPNGDVFRSHERHWFDKMPGRDTKRVAGDADSVRWSFGFPPEPPTQRLPLRGYLPIMTTSWETSGIRYEQTAFAALLDRHLGDLPIRGDDAAVAVVIVRLTNTSAQTASAYLVVRTHIPTGPETLVCDADRVVRTTEGKVRAIIEAKRGKTRNGNGAVRYEIALKPMASQEIVLKLPYFPVASDELSLLAGLDAHDAMEATAAYWESRIASSSLVSTPEPMLNDFYKAHACHLLINHERHVASPTPDGKPMDIARVGSFRYGAYTNESVMQISDLDRRGLTDEAAAGYELFVRYQGTVPLPGDFTNCDGVYYGAGGSEHGNYNQNHGWALWGLAEHYFNTRDSEWLLRVAPSIVKACDWITAQRSRTKETDQTGAKTISYGFLPAGVLEDIADFWYWLSTNAYTWWGMDRAAEALLAIRHPEAARLVAESGALKEDLVRGYTEAMVRCPVVRLQDGTAVPHFPSHQHLRGRSYGWIRETLEGAIHLLRCGVVPSVSDVGTWIMKDYEDNLYLSEQFGYSGASMPDLERFWFSRGGFSQQPNLLCGPLPYLYRDEIKHFLRAYFNAFAAGFHADTRMITEHPLPHLGDWAGDHFKSSDEAQNAYWLRLMFVYEQGSDLNYGFAVPRYWLQEGNGIGLKRALTYFGETSVIYRTTNKARTITAEIAPPTRNAPHLIRVRFRHPDGAAIRSVLLDGEPWTRFSGETVELPPQKKPFTLEAKFRVSRT